MCNNFRRHINVNRLFDDDIISNGYSTESDGTDESVGFLSKLFFCWTNKFVEKGYKGEIRNVFFLLIYVYLKYFLLFKVDDLFKLPPSLSISRVEREFLESAPTQFTDAQPFSFAYALACAFGFRYFVVGLLCFIGDCFKFAGPIMLHLLITSFEKREQDVSLFFYLHHLFIKKTFLERRLFLCILDVFICFFVINLFV